MALWSGITPGGAWVGDTLREAEMEVETDTSNEASALTLSDILAEPAAGCLDLIKKSYHMSSEDHRA